MAAAPPPTASPAPPGWHRFTTAEPLEAAPVVTYGAELPTEADLRLLGPVEGARVLDLGCGSGHNAVTLAQQGAKVIAVDPSAACLARARERAERAEVRVELHQGGLAELAFLRSDSVDAALSVMALASVYDVDRVFRQVHRVLKPQAPFVCSFPHPAFAMFDPTAADPLRVAHPYDQSAPLTWDLGPDVVTDHPRTVGELFTALNRASFLVDQLLEPTAPARGSRSGGFADAMTSVPATLVLRGRKQGN